MKRREPISASPAEAFAARNASGPAIRRVVPLQSADLETRPFNKFFKALSDETRRSILRLLEEREATVSEIVQNFDLSQPTISRHLSVLKEANLVVDRRRGQFVVYRLSGATMAGFVKKFFGEFSACREISGNLK
jgi:DNA-binding transcriptional ArsR family regulator